MSCFTVKNEAGENDPRFLDYVKLNNGDEHKALEQYVREVYFNDHESRFLIVSDDYQDTHELIDGSFKVDDKFTDIEANNIRANKETMYRKVFRNNTFRGEMFDAKGNVVEFDLDKLDEQIESYIKGKKELSGNVNNQLLTILGMKNIHDIQSFAQSLQKIFSRLNPRAIYSIIKDLKVDLIKDYSEMDSKPFYLKSLKDENIMIHEETVNGIKEYTIIMPTTERANKGFDNSERYSFMRSLFGDHKIAQKKGFTIKDSIKGRKQLTAAIVAMAIKASDPSAKVNGARFISFAGEGDTFDFDLYEGVRNVRALYKNYETRSLLPKELLDVISDVSDLKDEDFNPNYVDLLFRKMEERRMDKKPTPTLLYTALKGSDNEAKLQAIDERINFLVSNHDYIDNDGLRPYERFDSEMGKEMVLLAKAKEQLMQYAGLDRRAYNSNNMLTWFDAWRKSLGDMQNAQMNLLFNQYKSVIFGVKQRFIKFTKVKNEHVKAYMDAYEKDRGISAKSRVFNYTQEAYKNLYETIQVRKLENGKLSNEKVTVQTMKFKDPDDHTNGLKDYEREFIRKMVGLHKESIVRFIKKKMSSGQIKGYKTAEEWYNKEYKPHELNLPVMKKNTGNFLAEGSLKGAMAGISKDASDFLEITPAGMEKERSKRPFGSATMQLGGLHGKPGREKGLGLGNYNGELVLINAKVNNSVNLDVEQILHSAVYQNYKYEFEDQLTATYTAARIILMKDQADKGNSRSNELKTLEVLFNNLLYGERENIALGEIDVEAGLDWVRRTSSQAVLALNYKSALLATAGNMVALTTNALTARFGKHFFNAKDFGKAVKYALSNPKKFGDIVDMFMFHDRNESSMVFSDRMKEGERGWIKGRHLMMIHTLGDRFTKGLVLVAQLQHEGLLENFQYTKDGVLEYDWSKDKRSDAIKNQIRERNRKQEKDDIPYDDHQINTLISISAKIYGAYSDEDKTRVSTNAVAQTMAQFKGYLIARGNELYQTGFENTNISWYETDENGNVKATTYYQEGILNSVILFGKEMKRLEKSPVKAFRELRPEQQKNLMKLGTDLVFFGGLALLYGMLVGGDDDDETAKAIRKSSAFNYLKYAWLDVIGVYNAADYFDFFSPASITFFTNYVKAFADFMTLDFEDGLDKAWKATGVGKTVNDIAGLFEE